ncbi:MAG: hypothetical protein ILP08_04200 [Lachnospiraceae bacterium]|nr:hypothetical protein [Lachnospiraceae bacterium]
MRKKLCFLLPAMMAVVLCGCGYNSSNSVSQSDFYAVVEELDKAQTELAKLKENTVSKDAYDSIASERDELKAKVAELEAASEEKKTEGEDKNEVNPNEFAVYDDIQYVLAPFSVDDGCKWNIDRFEITDLQKSENKYKMNTTCEGTKTQDGPNLLHFYCYDENGYVVYTADVYANTNSTVKFKVQTSWSIPSETVKIDIK